MEYVVVSARERELDGKVNALIRSGWRPQGGISAVMQDNSIFNIWLFQSMVKD